MVVLMWLGATAVAFAATAALIAEAGVTGSVGYFPPFMLQGIFTMTTLASAGGVLTAIVEGQSADDDGDDY